VDDSVLSNYTEFGGVGFDDFELDGTHAATDEEGIAFADRSVCWYESISFQ
jgi:hypothetical protein